MGRQYFVWLQNLESKLYIPGIHNNVFAEKAITKMPEVIMQDTT